MLSHIQSERGHQEATEYDPYDGVNAHCLTPLMKASREDRKPIVTDTSKSSVSHDGAHRALLGSSHLIPNRSDPAQRQRLECHLGEFI